MPKPTRDNEKAAQVLLEAALTNDTEAADKYGITTRTVRRYREAVLNDPDLSAVFVRYTQEMLTREWADQLEETLTTALDKLDQHLSCLELASPKSILAITEAIKVLSEIAITKEVLSAGNPEQNQTGASASRGDAPNQGKRISN